MSERNKRKYTDAIVYGTKGAKKRSDKRQAFTSYILVAQKINAGLPIAEAVRQHEADKRFVADNIKRKNRILKEVGFTKALSYIQQVNSYQYKEPTSNVSHQLREFRTHRKNTVRS